MFVAMDVVVSVVVVTRCRLAMNARDSSNGDPAIDENVRVELTYLSTVNDKSYFNRCVYFPSF